jgi:hypothetical protein
LCRSGGGGAMAKANTQCTPGNRDPSSSHKFRAIDSLRNTSSGFRPGGFDVKDRRTIIDIPVLSTRPTPLWKKSRRRDCTDNTVRVVFQQFIVLVPINQSIKNA